MAFIETLFIGDILKRFGVPKTCLQSCQISLKILEIKVWKSL